MFPYVTLNTDTNIPLHSVLIKPFRKHSNIRKHKQDADSKQMKHQHIVDMNNLENQHHVDWTDIRHQHMVLRKNLKMNFWWTGII